MFTVCRHFYCALRALVFAGMLWPAAGMAGTISIGPEVAQPPLFLCGPGDPEDFLYRTDQQAFIDRLVANGGNTAYVQVVRSHEVNGMTVYIWATAAQGRKLNIRFAGG